MDLKDFRYVGEKPNLKKIPQNAYGFGVEKEDKEKYVTKLNENIQEIALLQDKLYAEGKEGVVFVLQAMDAAGKDGVVLLFLWIRRSGETTDREFPEKV